MYYRIVIVDEEIRYAVCPLAYRSGIHSELVPGVVKMATTKKNGNRYRSVKVASLDNRRRGKHHDLMEGIIDELKVLQEGSALKIPLDEIGGIELANLRSAVHRAAAADKISIRTQADEENFYVWKAQNSRLKNTSELV